MIATKYTCVQDVDPRELVENLASFVAYIQASSGGSSNDLARKDMPDLSSHLLSALRQVKQSANQAILANLTLASFCLRLVLTGADVDNTLAQLSESSPCVSIVTDSLILTCG